MSVDSSLVDAGTPGDYLVNYSSTDAANRVGTGTRTVQVVDFTPPVIVITDEDVTLQVGQQWNPYDGVVATDNTDGVLQPASSADLPLSGLRLHLDASQLSGLPNQGLVAEWKDSSPRP